MGDFGDFGEEGDLEGDLDGDLDEDLVDASVFCLSFVAEFVFCLSFVSFDAVDDAGFSRLGDR